MNLFIDEDTGPSIGRALRSVGFHTVDWIGKSRPVPSGTHDEVWLPYAGERGFLVLSCNFRMLQNERERQAIRDHSVGIIFLPGTASRLEVLRLIMRRWDWLQ